jgi:hypothetical protein
LDPQKSAKKLRKSAKNGPGPKNPDFGWWTPFLRNMNIGNYFLPKNNIAIFGISNFRVFGDFGTPEFLRKRTRFWVEKKWYF